MEEGSHITKAVAAEIGHQQNMQRTPQHEAAENGHSVINGVTQGSSNQSAAKVIDIQGNEKNHRNVLIGLWMMIGKKSSKVPYILSLAGSALLMGLYITSHTVGLALIGLD